MLPLDDPRWEQLEGGSNAVSSMHPLEQRIRAAFASNRYPGDDRLMTGGADESEETFRALQGKMWQVMPVVEFMQGDTPIPDLTPEAFHYYMPALLIASLGKYPDLACMLTFHLTPSQGTGISPEIGREWEQRLSLFTPEQRAVIKDTLRQYVVHDWDDEASVTEAIRWLDRVRDTPSPTNPHSDV